MEEIERLTKQVEMMKESVELMLTRAEQLFKMQEERLALLPRLAEQLQQAIDNQEVTDEAHRQALDQLEATTDDLAKVSAALLVIQQQSNEENNQQQQ